MVVLFFLPGSCCYFRACHFLLLDSCVTNNNSFEHASFFFWWHFFLRRNLVFSLSFKKFFSKKNLFFEGDLQSSRPCFFFTFKHSDFFLLVHLQILVHEWHPCSSMIQSFLKIFKFKSLKNGTIFLSACFIVDIIALITVDTIPLPSIVNSI